MSTAFGVSIGEAVRGGEGSAVGEGSVVIKMRPNFELQLTKARHRQLEASAYAGPRRRGKQQGRRGPAAVPTASSARAFAAEPVVR